MDNLHYRPVTPPDMEVDGRFRDSDATSGSATDCPRTVTTV